jgi:hypothetical protein
MAKEGGWPFRGGTSPEDLYYDQQLATYIVLPTLIGGGAAAAMAVIRALRSGPPKDLISPQRVTAGPMTINIPQDVGDDKEKQDLTALAETNGTTKEAVDLFKGPPEGTTGASMLTTKWAPMWLWPGAAALMYAGYEGGDLLGRYINKKRRKSRRERSISTARSDYDAAIKEQREAAKEASYEGEIDNLFDASRALNDRMSAVMEKEAGGYKHLGDIAKLDFGAIGKKFGKKFAPAISRYAGTLGIMAVLAGIPSGMMVYDKLRKDPKQDDLTEALRRRRSEMARRRPSAVQLELNMIAAPEDEDTDDAIAPAAI